MSCLTAVAKLVSGGIVAASVVVGQCVKSSVSLVGGTLKAGAEQTSHGIAADAAITSRPINVGCAIVCSITIDEGVHRGKELWYNDSFRALWSDGSLVMWENEA